MAERARQGDEGQMMLLGAVVLVIGFLVLSSITARLAQLPQETLQGTGPLLGEAKAVQAGIQELDAAVHGDASLGSDAARHAAFTAGLDRLAAVGQGRGFLLSYACPGAGGSPSLALTLSDGNSWLTLTLALQDPNGGAAPAPNC